METSLVVPQGSSGKPGPGTGCAFCPVRCAYCASQERLAKKRPHMFDSHKLSIILCKLNYIVMIMPVMFRNGQDHIALIGRYRSMWRRCMNHHVPAGTTLTATCHCGKEL